MKIGELIRSRRKEESMTLRELADKLGISQPYLSQIEGSRRKPTQELIRKFASELEIDEKQLLHLAGYHAPQSKLIELIQEFQELNNTFQKQLALQKSYLERAKVGRKVMEEQIDLLEEIMRGLPGEAQIVFKSDTPIQEKLTILQGNVKALEKAQQLEESIKFQKTDNKHSLQMVKGLEKQNHLVQKKMLELQEAIHSEVNSITENNLKMLEQQFNTKKDPQKWTS